MLLTTPQFIEATHGAQMRECSDRLTRLEQHCADIHAAKKMT